MIALLAAGLRAGDLATWAFLAGAAAIALMAVRLRAWELPGLTFLAGALAITFLPVGLRAGDLATLPLLAAVFAARFAVVLLADFFAVDFFVVFFDAATFFFPFIAFFAFFAMIVLHSSTLKLDFPNHTGEGCNGTVHCGPIASNEPPGRSAPLPRILACFVFARA